MSTKANKKAINNVKVDEGTLKASHSKNQLDLGGTKEPTATVEMSYFICSGSTWVYKFIKIHQLLYLTSIYFT